MAAVDISVWVGKPPARVKVPDVAMPDPEQDGEEGSLRRKTDSDSLPSESVSYKDASASPRGQSQTQSRPNTRSPAYQTHHENSFYIDIPPLTDNEDYEHLPGYFAVHRILREVTPGHYLVELRSGEVDLLTRKDLHRFVNSSSALQHFHSSTMASTSRRPRRKPQAEGFVNWTSLNLWSSDEASPRKFGQRPRGNPTQDSEESADSEREPRSSADEEGSDSDPSPPVGRRSLRLTMKKENDFAENEIGDDLSDDSAIYETSMKRGKKRSRNDTGRSKRGLHSRSKTRKAVGNQISNGTRRSERTRTQPRRNMRERHEDEISAYSEEEIGPKIVAAKEYFERLPLDDEFRNRHREQCETCGIHGDRAEKGPLVFCQGCTSSYHKTCLGNRGTREHLVTKIGEGQFVLQCRRCLGMAQHKDPSAPHHGLCSACKAPGPASSSFRPRLTTREEQLRREEHGGVDPITEIDPSLINSSTNVMFRCANCQQGWHMHHLPRREHDQQEEGDDVTLDEQSLADARFDYYSRSGTCKECIEHNSQIDALVAWRPADLDKYIPGSTLDMIEESQKEYLIKWKTQSYFQTTWMPGAWLWGVAASSMRVAFMKKAENQMPKMTTEDAIPEDWLRVDIVLDVIYTSVVTNRSKEIDFARAKEVDSAYVKYKGLGYEDAIWENPPSYDEKERWADFKSAYDDWVLKNYVHTPSPKTLRRHLQTVRNKDFESELLKDTQPATVTGGQLMDYQLEGMNWLYYQWYKAQNCILADEMGLGKTIQIIAYFAMMVQDHKCWPFLVVVPNSTCPNWRREIKKWAPSLRAVTYFGSSVARKITQDYELFPKDEEEKERKKPHDKSQPKDLRAHIVITSYESVVEEKARQNLQKVAWAGLIVDEGQRLKNEKNLLYENLSKMRFPFKVLLTGTPLQNNARELFNLLQFLDPKINAAAMDAKYEILTKENVPELHELIRPFFLRRTKAQVLTFLPPMAQIILPVSMSVVQKKLYKSILAKNPQLMKSIFSRNGIVAQKERVNLNNILMQLRKTLCHPFVYNREIEERSYELAVSHRNLVEASSKLQLLQLMLPKLQERGHRVLLFSQFLDNLDIVEDFLDGLGLQHRRLDGSIDSLEKQKRIDDFNAPDSPYFAFLLSTRSGGVGINLASADTVIIMDPDFNPHQDIQALSRAHRIGQKNKVLVFQIMTRGSAEEKIMQIGKKKMVLDHILIQQLDQEDDAGMDLESVLRHGAEALFRDDDTGDIVYDPASVDKLLDRSQMETTETGEDKSAESQFSFARVWANDRAALEDNLGESETTTPADTTVWDRILKEREEMYAEEAAARAETLGRGKRKRNAVDYQAQETLDAEPNTSPFKARNDGSDTDFQADGVDSDAGESIPAEKTDSNLKADLGPTHAIPKQAKIKARPFKRVKIPTGNPPYADADGASNYIPIGGLPPNHLCIACGDLHPMGWCRLKLAGVEHCGLCGIAHLGHGRTCPHLNSEIQVSTLLGTLKESTEPQELKDKANKYLRMIRGDLVQRKRLQERKGQKQANSGPTGYQPRVPATRIDGSADMVPHDRPAINEVRDFAEAWRSASAWSHAHGLYPPIRSGHTSER